MKRLGEKFVAGLLLAVVATVSGGDETASSRTQMTLDDLRTFTDVFNQVRVNFVEEMDDRTLLDAAIRGMLSELDPHSSYMDAEEFRQMDNSSQGRYSGIGVEVAIREKRIEVVFVTEGGPAEQAGIVSGDVITAIGQTDVRDRDLQAAIDSLRGEVGTDVEITVEHESGEVSTHTLTRDYVKVSSVFSRPVDQHYGYFQITHFTRHSAEELLEQIEYMQGNHEGPLKGIVLDIRSNPGGVLQPAVTIADGFLGEGLIVSTRGRAANQLEYRAKPEQWVKDDIPLVVLVNRSSASASEVLAGALQDHGRALIIGERTFGKGSVQSVLNLRNGGGMRLTTARYYTPSGRSIQAEGIRPDIDVAPVEVIESAQQHTREADLDRHLDNEATADERVFDSEISAAEDYMMYQALILLKGASLLGRNAATP